MVDSKRAARLKRARIDAGHGNVREMTDTLGWNINTYRSHENAIRGIPTDKIELYARTFGVTVQWLMTGKGKPGKLTAPAPQMLPVLGNVQGGAFVEADAQQDNEPPLLPVMAHPDWIDYKQYLLRVEGPSMNKDYPEGTYVHCAHIEFQPDGLEPENGDHVIVERRRGGLVEVTVKEYAITLSGPELRPRSHDPSWQKPIRLNDERDIDEIVITAIVIGSYRPRHR